MEMATYGGQESRTVQFLVPLVRRKSCFDAPNFEKVEEALLLSAKNFKLGFLNIINGFLIKK